MTTVANGVVGGAVVALVAAGVVGLFGSDRSARASLSRALFGRETSLSRVVGVVLPFVYGALAGGALLALELSLLGMLAVPPALDEALAVTVAWSVVLLTLAAAVWRSVLDLSFDSSGFGDVVLFHVVYGLALGAWIRLTWIT